MARIRPGFRLRRGQNLADLTDPTAARGSLGLGSAAVQDDTRYAHRANNLSDLGNVATARSNLNLGSAAVQDSSAFVNTDGGHAVGLQLEKYIWLHDYDDGSGADTGLRFYVRDGALHLNPQSGEGNAVRLKIAGSTVWHTGNHGPGSGLDADRLDGMHATGFAYRGNNLSDLDNVATARSNLNLGSAAVQNDTRYAHRGNNLSDLGSAATARSNLGVIKSTWSFSTGMTHCWGVGADGSQDEAYVFSGDEVRKFANAGAGVGQIGTYAQMKNVSGTGHSPGDTVAATDIRYAATDGQYSAVSRSGTWRCMGHAPDDRVTLYMRIS